MSEQLDDDWRMDCLKWRGRVLIGGHRHWCPDWDFLPVDETTDEWPCVCCRDGTCTPAAPLPDSRNGVCTNSATTAATRGDTP